jgi:hypothetical protein
MEQLPHQLFEDLSVEAVQERAARVGRFMVLEEMGFFGEKTNIDLAKAQGSGSWVAQVRKRFSGIYGDVAGCHPADLEIAAEMLGVFDEVYNIEALTDDRAA